MSHVANQKAIDATANKMTFAIFITRMNNRYAVRFDGLKYLTYIETNRGWESCECLANFLVWNGEFQGYDDITSLIAE